MASAILSAVMDSCATTQAAGEEPRFSRFIATCNSVGTEKSLQSRFSSYSGFLVMRGQNINAMDLGDVILLSFKPYMIDLVLKHESVREALAGKLVMSVLAGSPVQKIESAIFTNGPRLDGEKPFYIQRAMPNLAAEYSESMTLIERTDVMPAHYEELSNWIFSQIGKTASIAAELYDVGGVLTGASSALLSVAVDGMLDAAVSQGLKRADAKTILTQTLVSLAKLLENEHPAVLREKVSSPKGTTIAGLLSLEEDRARYAYTRAVNASSERSKEIGRG